MWWNNIIHDYKICGNKVSDKLIGRYGINKIEETTYKFWLFLVQQIQKQIND